MLRLNKDYISRISITVDTETLDATFYSAFAAVAAEDPSSYMDRDAPHNYAVAMLEDMMDGVWADECIATVTDDTNGVKVHVESNCEGALHDAVRYIVGALMDKNIHGIVGRLERDYWIDTCVNRRF